jgi:hypothetical protein
MATQIEDVQAQTPESACPGMSMPKPQAEHAWLQRLVGEWTSEMEADFGDGRTTKVTGTESIRALGGFWIVGEGTGDGPDGAPATDMFTLGYDPQQGRYVGSWASSCMPFMRIYDCTMDANQRVLTLASDGPSFEVPGKTAKYRDIIEIIGDDQRTLSSNVLGEDGEWHEMMKMYFKRA